VAAAGNSAGGPVSIPANCSGVIAVLALRHAGSKVGFSDLGPQISIAAPGGNCINTDRGTPCLYPILAATNSGTHEPADHGWTDSDNYSVGTSYSSPLVAGVAALMVAQRPELTAQKLRELLQSSARPFPTTGADNGPGDPTPVSQCHAPATGVDQLQCYCNTTYCGAGMMDAGAAVEAAATFTGPMSVLRFGASQPVAGAALTLDGSQSMVAGAGSIASYQWRLVDGGGIVANLSSTTTASVSVTPSAKGHFSVQLTVTDTSGREDSTTMTIAVVEAPADVSSSSSGGGGAASLWWVLGVLTAAVALRHTARRV
jgi:serine protease